MKKKLFSCFHPLVLETETDQINVDPTISPSITLPNDHNKKGLKNSAQKRPFSHVLEILLLKASLKIKSVRQLSLQHKNARLRKMYRRLQVDGDDRTGSDKRVEEAEVSQTEIRSSSCESKNTRSFDHEESKGPDQFRLMIKPCSCKMNLGLYLLLVTLFFTVVWGRVRAVLFALVFLYSIPVWAGFLR
ncbi:hypothetical protein C2S51_038041 [Perilla frutescens var. frutescens]|nr:hypothetical protein C2S51_038041 [Perilla frutescens var. frutescens]